MISQTSKSAFCKLLIFAASQVHASWPEVKYSLTNQEDYPSWGQLFGENQGQYSGYVWEPYAVETSDGWELT